ncbi:MAG TPA: hypothetical protein VNZ67_11045, partial [bacterium]|nr:hypothetical protein [bacterium]
TFTVTPTPTESPCDLLYKGHFGKCPEGTSLDAMGFTTITAESAKAWSLVKDPATGKPAAAPETADGWHFVKYGVSSTDYIDFHAHIDAGPPTADNQAYLFWNAQAWIGYRPTLEQNGYALKFQPGDDTLLYKGIVGEQEIIGYDRTPPRDYTSMEVEVIDNHGDISVLVDGALSIHVRDSQYPSGYWGFGGHGKVYFSRLRIDGPACLATNTPTPTMQPTPTPAYLPAPCAAPFPKVWALDPAPAVTPVSTWEGGAMNEAMVLKIKGVYHMTYSGGWGAEQPRPEAIGLKTSTDGTHWKSYGDGPILGNGHGGEARACMGGTQVKVGSEYRIYYRNYYGDIKYARSSDGFHYAAVGIAIPFNDQEDGGAQCHWNSGYYFDGTDWWAIVDSLSTRGAYRAKFFTNLYKSTDGARTFHPVSDPLFGLQEEGSTRTIFKAGKLYHMFHLVGYPSDIRHSASPDLYHWTLETAQAMTFTTQEYGLDHVDQAADPAIFQMPDGSLKMLFSVVNNQDGKAVIGQATYPGNFEDLAGCVAPGGQTPAPAQGR